MESKADERTVTPVSAPLETPGGTASSSPSDRASHPTRILVIDDEALIGRLIERLLDGERTVVPMTSARAALHAIVGGEAYQAILCDLMMPDMSGMEFVDKLLATHPEQASRIVLMTGGAFTAKAQEFLSRVALPQLEKPFNGAALRRALSLVPSQ